MNDKIYYCNITGQVLLVLASLVNVKDCTFDEHYQMYSILNERTKETIGLIELEFGEFEKVSKNSTGMSVNLETKELEFTYNELPQESDRVDILEDKISILTEKLESVTLANTRLQESTFKYMVTQNRLTLTSRYSADKVTFKVDYESLSVVNERVNELDHDLFKLIKDNVLVGKDNYNYDEMINMLDFYQSIGFIDWDMWDEIFVIMELNLIKPEETPEI